HYGLFANGHRADKLELCRRALNVLSPRSAHANSDNTGPTCSGHEPPPCPCCGGRLIVIETFHGPLSSPYHVPQLRCLYPRPPRPQATWPVARPPPSLPPPPKANYLTRRHGHHHALPRLFRAAHSIQQNHQ